MISSLSSAQTEGVLFSHPGGFYDEPFALSLECWYPQHHIFYTLNGNMPNTDAHPYVSPLMLDEHLFSTSDIYQIQISPADKVFIPDTEPKTIVIRAAVFDEQGNRISDVLTQTYLIRSLIGDTHGLPVVSVCADSLALFDYDTGILVPGRHFDPENPLWTGNYYQTGREWERLCNVEFYEQDNTGFNQQAGLRTQGGNARRIPQKGLKIYARDEYGKKRFKHKIFDCLDQNSFKHLVLKPFCDPWSETCIQDYVCNRMAATTYVDALASRPAILYLNGEYWGIYYVREKPDEHYLEDHHGVDEQECTVISDWDGNLDTGDSTSFLELMEWVSCNDLSDSDNYARLCQMIDMDNFIDYQILEMFIANKDWPGNNMRCWQAEHGVHTAEPTQWRWIFFDGDAALMYRDLDEFANATCIGHYEWPATKRATLILRNLLSNSDFVERFSRRFNTLLREQFSYANTHIYVEEIRSLVQGEVPRQAERFGHPVGGSERWQRHVDHVDDFLASRCQKVQDDFYQFFTKENLIISDLNVAPNPVIGENLTIRYHSDAMSFSALTLTDVVGRVLKRGEVLMQEGENVIELPIDLAAGCYLLDIGGQTVKFIVIRR